MYLSTLLINVGTNPDRPRPGRLWLRNAYRVHQRLCMAFPTVIQRDEDPEFLKPYRPWGFHDPRPERCTINTGPEASVRPCAVAAMQRPAHVPRDTEHNFLFRIDPQFGGRAVILVQSAIRPDWDYAFHNASHLLACRPEVRPFDPRFQPDQRLRFCLVANPVRKVSRKSLDFAGNLFEERWHGKDVPVPTADLPRWLERRAEPSWSAPKNSEHKQPRPGFRLSRINEILGGYVYVNKSLDHASGRRVRSARYEGVLEVTDAESFRNTVIRGIGPGKAFGFGLLSIAPVRS
jgi:CRISPR system Cascade subunit CasE